MVIVGVVKSLTNLLFWAWRRVRRTGYCERGGEFERLVIVSVGESLINCLLWAWGRV
jgi:hypothetical protein